LRKYERHLLEKYKKVLLQSILLSVECDFLGAAIGIKFKIIVILITEFIYVLVNTKGVGDGNSDEKKCVWAT